METFLSILIKLFSVILLVLSILSSLMLILTFRKPRKVSVPSLLITSAIGLVTLVLFAALINYQPEIWVWLVMGLAGAGIGVLQARTTLLYREETRVMSRNSVWYIVVWAALLAFNQLITIITSRPPDITMAILIMGSAVVWGTSGDIIRRYFKMKPAVVVKHGQPLPSAETAPVEAEQAQNTRLVASLPVLCKKCGHKVAEGDFFCHSCGEKQ